MRYNTHNLSALPRLVLEKSETIADLVVGYLQVSQFGKKIEIGNANGKEFRLIQCLFSPQNTPSAKYDPVIQTYERIFRAMQVKSASSNIALASREGTDLEMVTTVKQCIQSIRKGEVGSYVVFVTGDGRVQLEIAKQ